MKQTTFVEKVLAFLKGGDEAKVVRFESKVVKYLKKQIAQRKDELESLEDKVTDAKEALAEVVVNVDVNRINNTDSTEDYAVTYVSSVDEAMEEVEDLESEIEGLEAEIERLEKIQATIFPSAE